MLCLKMISDWNRTSIFWLVPICKCACTSDKSHCVKKYITLDTARMKGFPNLAKHSMHLRFPKFNEYQPAWRTKQTCQFLRIHMKCFRTGVTSVNVTSSLNDMSLLQPADWSTERKRNWPTDWMMKLNLIGYWKYETVSVISSSCRRIWLVNGNTRRFRKFHHLVGK